MPARLAPHACTGKETGSALCSEDPTGRSGQVCTHFLKKSLAIRKEKGLLAWLQAKERDSSVRDARFAVHLQHNLPNVLERCLGRKG